MFCIKLVKTKFDKFVAVAQCVTVVTVCIYICCDFDTSVLNWYISLFSYYVFVAMYNYYDWWLFDLVKLV